MEVFVGSCVWRNAEIAHMGSLMGLISHPEFHYRPQIGDALIDRARNISASTFLNTDYDVHLSIDSDITGFSYEDTVRMCEAAEEYGIVGAVYVCRSPSQTHPASFYLPGVMVEHAFDHTPVEVKYVATGFVAVHRWVFEKMAETLPLLNAREKDIGKAFYPFYMPMIYGADDPDIGQDIELSEDWAFGQRAAELGIKSYVDPAIRLGHIGSYTYRLEDTAQKQPEAQPLAIKREGLHWEVFGNPETLSRSNGSLETVPSR